MVTVYDVPANELVNKTAEKLKEMGIKQPEWIGFVKSGAHAQRKPESKDFWFVRCASILRQVYTRENIGVNRLRRHYGGAKNRGVRPSKHSEAGGKIIREGMKQLESIGLVEKKKTGREITGKGRKLLDNVAYDVKKEIRDAKEKENA